MRTFAAAIAAALFASSTRANFVPPDDRRAAFASPPKPPSPPATMPPSPDGGWSEVCAIEKNRALAHVAQHGSRAPLETPLPLSSNRTFDMERKTPKMELFSQALKELLNSRGTLRSIAAPCRVQWKAGRKGIDGTFDVCLPQPRGATLCEVTQKADAQGEGHVERAFLLRKACNEGSVRRCLEFNGRTLAPQHRLQYTSCRYPIDWAAYSEPQGPPGDRKDDLSHRGGYTR